MKADILAFAAHPDDVELAASGTLMKHIALGKTAGIVDFTQGQLGSRGTPALRLEEADSSSEILGLQFRENLGMQDGWFRADQEHIRAVAHMIRKYRPEVLLCNAPKDRHPDHGRASALSSEAAFFSGLAKLKTGDEDFAPWRPQVVLHYIQDRPLDPDVIVDISDYMERKMDSIQAFSSQFYNPESEAPDTPISSKEFLEVVRGRAREMGRYIGVEYGEGFIKERAIGVPDLTALS